MYDFLIAGAGFAGSIMAERLAAQGYKILLIDRRPHLAGNAYDVNNHDGILIHQYGPHIFHTNSDRVFEYLSRFTDWRPYEHRVLASVSGKLLPIPINLDTVNKLYNLKLTGEQLEAFFAERAEPISPCKTSEDVVLSKVGRDLYEKFFKNYTLKQWGLDPSQLDATVIARIPVRTNRDDRYFGDKHQAMPRNGFTAMFGRMVSHPNIKIMLNTTYQQIREHIPHRYTIFTGPVDEFFEYRFGRLPYRSLEFQFKTLDRAWAQTVAVVNYPNDHDYTRVTEFKHLTGQKHPKTTVVYEYPRAVGDPYYPIPRPENASLYARYEALARQTPGVWFVGRLATYKYYNMDQVAGQALATSDKIIAQLREGKEAGLDTSLSLSA